MSAKQSLIQLSAYDPRTLPPAGTPQGEMADRADGTKGAQARTKTASAADRKKQEILAKFHASDDPKERMRLLDEALKV